MGKNEDIELLKHGGGEGEIPEMTVEEPARVQWGHKAEFLLACVSYAVGLGNIWRFPWLVQQNGGGAFLIPYFVMLIVEGIPLFYMELNIGQKFRLGPIPAWKKISPWALGVGYCMCVASFLSGSYYNVIIAWCMYYFFKSFASPLPFASCPKPYYDETLKQNITSAITKCQEIGSTQYYWYYEALKITDSIDDRAGVQWEICLCLLAAWTLVALCMMKGIQSTGKVVYFTATFPYLVLLIFTVQGLLLKGSGDGLKHFFVPEWHRLGDPKVWMEAAAQIFFSLSLAFGGLIAYSSYNDEHNDTLKDTVIVCLTNCLTSIFGGISIFSILGYRATLKSEFCYKEFGNRANETFIALQQHGGLGNQTYQTIYSAMTSECTVKHFLGKGSGGSGLAFIAFTEAIIQLPGSTFFSLIFFLMLITLGLGSMFGTLEGLVTSLRDMPFFQRFRKEVVIVVVAIPGFLSGIGFTQYSGEYVVQLFNKFSVDIPILLVGLLELIFISWIYGLERFCDEIEEMTGRKVHLVVKLLWKYISPMAIFIMLVLSLYGMAKDTPSYDAWDTVNAKIVSKPYPAWALTIGIMIFTISFLFVPIGALLQYYRKRGLNEEKPSATQSLNPK